ncbi:MAG TPA: hypothetical protein PLE48_03275 [Thiobacillus sp.]|nr:MAG: hypothetical protein B7Y50_11985 [Hydrogenophilales bacterium 28-61-11]OYZ56307.1 MAG: hypothetical protein B7Y21_12070 [Hydrogenophilales bacterium 16-61-112]OZA48255.1 MAG: hypothetical protein B7X81_04165 [Hydrogenophilales bacterium 17-61-76]HQT29846.1 hypothetical protein [Thiobacillus sp.]HQT69427.1 hypothetical protein [Thiobacillus sp.]
MSDHIPDTPNTPTDASSPETVDQSRRKLAGGAIGATAILTLASRPVLAGVCESPSAAFSGNMSQHGTPITCSGLSPGYWKEKPNKWPVSYDPGSCSNQCNQVENWSAGTLFHPLFSGDNFIAYVDGGRMAVLTSLSMMQVMQMSNGNNPWDLSDPDNLGAHIVAALLNAAAGLTPVLSESDVTNMWREWESQGYFEPVAGVKWKSKEIVDYIKSTFH